MVDSIKNEVHTKYDSHKKLGLKGELAASVVGATTLTYVGVKAGIQAFNKPNLAPFKTPNVEAELILLQLKGERYINTPSNAQESFGKLGRQEMAAGMTWFNRVAEPDLLDKVSFLREQADASLFGNFSAKLDDLRNISKEYLGPLVGHGAESNVYSLDKDHVVTVTERFGDFIWEKPISSIALDLDGRHQLMLKIFNASIKAKNDYDLPIVEAKGFIRVDGQPATIYERGLFSTKELFDDPYIKGARVNKEFSPYLNHKTLDDINYVIHVFKEGKLWAGADIEGIVGKDGSFGISDIPLIGRQPYSMVTNEQLTRDKQHLNNIRDATIKQLKNNHDK